MIYFTVDTYPALLFGIPCAASLEFQPFQTFNSFNPLLTPPPRRGGGNRWGLERLEPLEQFEQRRRATRRRSYRSPDRKPYRIDYDIVSIAHGIQSLAHLLKSR